MFTKPPRKISFTSLLPLLITFYALQGHLSQAYRVPVSSRNFFPPSFLTLLAFFIYDLMGGLSNELELNTELAFDWTVSGFLQPSQSRVSSCTQAFFLGGPGYQSSQGYMTRTYTNIGSHGLVTFGVTISLMGAWQSGDTFSIQIDDHLPYDFHLSSSPMTNDVCIGNTTLNSFKSGIVGRLFHTSSNITVKIYWKIKNTVSSTYGFGIKDLSLQFGARSSTDTEIISLSMSSPIISSAPACESLKYFSSSTNKCESCNAACLDCFGPTILQCYRLKFPCSSDGSTSFKCTSPCLSCWGAQSNQCSICGSSSFLYSDNTCQSSCSSPLIAVGPQSYKACLTACGASQYRAWNNSCISSCDLPLVQNNIGGEMTCSSPCGQSILEILYWNGSCLPTCPYYQRSISSYYFCDACQSGYYSYPNASCYQSCYPSFSVSKVGGSRFCNYPCTANQYLYKNGSCSGTCYTGFTIRIEGSFAFCDYPCDSTTFVYQNKSCYSTCQAGFIVKIEGDYNLCIYPCLSGQYLYPDKTCTTTCPAAYTKRIEGSYQFCDYPCKSSQYLYQNGSCLSTCENGFTAVTANSKKSCNYPCTGTQVLYQDGSCREACYATFNLVSQGKFKLCNYPCSSNTFLYQNKSCLHGCTSGFNIIVEGSYTFCNYPCSSGQYLYQNTSCLATCSFPFYERKEGTFKFCDFICPDLSNYYYPDERYCRPACSYPYSIIGLVQCEIILSASDAAQAATISNITNATSQALGATSVAMSFFSLGDPTSFFLIALSSMLTNIRYIKIAYPPKLKTILNRNVKSESSIKFISNIHRHIEAHSINYPLPDNFAQYKFHSGFLVNFWSSLVTFLFIIVLIGMVTFLTAVTGKYKKMNWVFKSLRDVLKWNFFFTYVMSLYGEIILYTSFELRTARMNSPLAVCSALILVLVNALPLIIFVKTLILVSCLYHETIEVHERVQKQMLKEFNVKWKGHLVLYENFRPTHWSQRAFFLIYSLRIYLFYMVIAYMYTNPMAQAVIITVMNVAMIGYLFWRYPIKNNVRLIQNFVQEIVLLIVNVCMATLAIFDLARVGSVEAKEKIAELIIYCIIIFSWTGLAFLLIHLAVTQILKRFIRKEPPIPPVNQERAEQPLAVMTFQDAKNNSALSVNLDESQLQLAPARIAKGRTLRNKAISQRSFARHINLDEPSGIRENVEPIEEVSHCIELDDDKAKDMSLRNNPFGKSLKSSRGVMSNNKERDAAPKGRIRRRKDRSDFPKPESETLEYNSALQYSRR